MRKIAMEGHLKLSVQSLKKTFYDFSPGILILKVKMRDNNSLKNE